LPVVPAGIRQPAGPHFRGARRPAAVAGGGLASVFRAVRGAPDFFAAGP